MLWIERDDPQEETEQEVKVLQVEGNHAQFVLI